MKKLIVISMTLLFSAVCLSARTITVTSNADTGLGTLRQAIADADNGDVIVFADNVTTVYFAGVIILDKKITISGNEANNTVFQDASVWTDTVHKRRFFEILRNAEVTLNYLTLKDHTSNCTGGAIISMNGSKVALHNCTFSNNRCYDSGGAIAMNGILNIDNCNFIDNYAPKGGGGAITFSVGKITITNSRFTGNAVPKVSSGIMFGAGAVYIGSSAAADISNCIFEKNISSDGGAMCNHGAATINNCTFRKNKATMGGSVANHNQISISNSEFYQNEAQYNGIFDSNSFNSQRNVIAILANCLFRNNTMTGYAYPNASSDAVISLSNGFAAGQLTLINCTVADNTGTGISYLNRVIGSTVTLYNTILWNNITERDEQYDVYKDLLNENNVVLNVYNSLVGTSYIDLNENNNIIGVNPLFAGNGDYSLQENSPAIDAGNNTCLPAGIIVDVDGNQRISNATVDLGAYELQQQIASDPNISTDTTKIAVAFYTIMGVKLNAEPESGIYIILYDNGKIEKRMK